MSERTAYCGIDVGTSGVRCVLVDADGRLLSSGSASLTSDRPGHGRHEQDPRSWWDALVTAVREATDAAPEARVEAVALDATSGTVLVERRDGTTAGPALMYDDARATDLAPEAQEAGAELWAELGYRIQPTWALPRAMWLVRHADLADGDRVVHQSDHLVGRLTGAGAEVTDTSSALKTGADQRHVRWPEDVLARLGLPVERLPRVVLPGTPVGTVSAEAAAATGLPEHAVVRAGMTDGCAAQLASGAVAPGSWSSALGTTLVVKGAVEDLLHDPSGAVYCHRHPDGGWLPGGASSSGAGVFAEALPGADLDSLTRLVAAEGDPAAAAYPLAGTGERFPFASADAHRTPVAAGGSDTAVFGSLCLGLAFVERLAYDVLGGPVDRGGLGADVSGPVALTGGATRNRWLNQLRTDVLGRPTTVPASAEAAVGMAVLAAAAPGELTATAARMVRVGRRQTPDLERGRSLRPAYVDFVQDLVRRGWLDADRAAPALDEPAGTASGVTR